MFFHKHRIQRFFTKPFLSYRLFLRNCFQRNAVYVSSIDHMLLPGSYQIPTSHNIFISKKSNKILLSFFSPKIFYNIELFHLIDQGDFTYLRQSMIFNVNNVHIIQFALSFTPILSNRGVLLFVKEDTDKYSDYFLDFLETTHVCRGDTFSLTSYGISFRYLNHAIP